jgi:hypothetical protein
MPKQAPNFEEWNKHKDTITKRYIDENLPLQRVMKLMSDDGFTRTYVVKKHQASTSASYIDTLVERSNMKRSSTSGSSKSTLNRKHGDSLQIVSMRENLSTA